jgi:hypothetical protein
MMLLLSALALALGAPASAGIGCAVDSGDRLPFVVLITNARKEEACTGSVVGGRFVVTAAHCLYAGSKEDQRLTGAGSIRVFSGPDGDRPAPAVKTRTPHPDYRGPFKGGPDVAVLELEAPLPSSVERAAQAPPARTAAVLAGYGVTRHGAVTIDRKRRFGDGRVAVSNEELICLEKALLADDSKVKGGRCVPASQDSGSPLLVGGRTAGVFSSSRERWYQDGSTLVEDCYVNLAHPSVRAFLDRTLR